MKLYHLLAVNFFFVGAQATHLDRDETRGSNVIQHYYASPALEEENILRKDVCVRPGYEGAYDIQYQQKGAQHFFTMSGFGGSGITLGESVVLEQINHLEKDILPALKYGKHTEITVVGNGWVGSQTALHLDHKGYRNVRTVFDGQAAHATSNAGGYIAASISENDPEYSSYNQHCINAFKSFKDALTGQHPFMESGKGEIQKIPVYRTGGKSPALENIVKAKLMHPGFEVDLNILYTGKRQRLYCYQDALYVNPSSIIRQLHEHINQSRIQMTERQINSINDVQSEIVFNCTGTAAGRLIGQEEKYKPVLGHYILLKDQDSTSKELGPHNSMIVASGDSFRTHDGQEAGLSLNLFPKTGEGYDAYLGGTFVKNVGLNQHGYVSDSYKTSGYFKSVLQNARKFFGNDSHT